MTARHHGDEEASADLSSAAHAPSNLALRVASAAVLAPLALGCAYVGGPLFLALCALAAGIILCEWTGLVAARLDVRIVLPGLAALLVGAILVGFGRPGAATGAIAAGAAVAGGLTGLGGSRASGSNLVLWAAGGVVYAGAAFLGPALLRGDPEWGLAAVLFLAGTVWATDIFAYGVGRAIGGPLLAPRISPHKTWAGAVGGLCGGVAAGVLVAYASGVSNLAPVAMIALVLSVLTQAGDLFESAVKRRFGAKDASHLIPGHGGLMDRLDGFLVAASFALLIGALRHGAAAPAQGLLLW